MKKGITMALIIAMLTSICVIPASAADNNETVNRYTVLVLDTSGPSAFLQQDGQIFYVADTAIEYVKVASSRFLSNISDAAGNNYVAVVSYKESASIISDFTTDYDALNSSIQSLFASENQRDMSAGIATATALLEAVSDPNAIKNLVLFTTGMTTAGDYSYTGHFNENTVGSNWRRKDTGVNLYAYANIAYERAEEAKDQGIYVYTIGLFQTLDDMPEYGQAIVGLFKLTTLDVATSSDYYYPVDDPNNLEFTFGEVANSITNDNVLKTITFTYGGGDTATCYYTNEYFSSSSYEYNQSLGTMSLAFAMSAFGDYYEPYANQSKNAKNLLMDIGVPETNIVTNDWFTVKPTTDSIGVIAGNMPIRVNDTDYTLIALAVRGGGYEREWASNFTIGTSGLHDGFDTAKENVLSFLHDYIVDQQITGPVKIWITGYSRAAATSNLVGGAIDEGTVLSSDISYDLDDVYTYCFETPAGALSSEEIKKGIYTNIFNIINRNDPVVYVAPYAMGFGRYGIDRYLPSKETDGDDYDFKLSAMLSILGSLNNNNTYTVDGFQMKKLGVDANVNWDWFNTSVDWNFILDDTNNNLPQSVFLNNYVLILSKDFIIDRNNYVNVYQDEIREICSVVFGCTSEQSRIMMDSLISQAKDNWGALAWSYVYNVGVQGLFPWNWDEMSAAEREDAALQIISDWLINAINDAGITDYNSAMIDRAGKDIGDLALALVSNHPNYFTTAIMNGEGLGAAHYPELCFAWMASMDSNYSNANEASFNTGSYRIVRINCKVDVAVFDESGNVVASIVNETPQEIDGCSLVSAINEDGEKIIILPINASYEICITGREDDTVDFGIDEYCALAGDFTRAVDYFDICLLQGQSLTGSIPAYDADEISDDTQLINGSTAAYTLYSPDNTLIPSDSDLSGEEASNAYFAVNAISADNSTGVALGSGIRQYGNHAQVEAYANKGYEFEGWYKNGIKVSSDAAYRFRVTEDINLEARFEEKKSFTITFDGNGGIPSDTSMNTEANGRLTTLPTASRRWHDFMGWFTAPSGGTQITADTVFAEDTTVYARWKYHGGSIAAYPPIIIETEHGAVEVSPKAPTQNAKVTITVTPEETYTIDTVVVTDTKGKEISVTKNENGTYSFTQPGERVKIVATFKSAETRFTVVNPAEGGSLNNIVISGKYREDMFSDVDPNAWYYRNVKAAVEYNLMVGYDNGKFGIGDSLKISEALAIADRLHNMYYGGSGEFDQTQDNRWYQVYEDYAVFYGIVKAGEYDLSADASRSQLVAIISAALPNDAFQPINNIMSIPDVDKDNPNYAAIMRLYNAGVLTGVDKQGTFMANSTITREQIAAIITRVADPNLRWLLRGEQRMVFHISSIIGAS